MEDEGIDDIHLCLNCHVTINGLQNYVDHKKNVCPTKGKPGQRSRDLLNIPINTSTLPSEESITPCQISSGESIQLVNHGKTSLGNNISSISNTGNSLAVSLSTLETSRSFLSQVQYPLEIFTTDVGQQLHSSLFASPIKSVAGQVAIVSDSHLISNPISKICSNTDRQCQLKGTHQEKCAPPVDHCDKDTEHESMPDAATVADFFSSLELKVREPSDKHPCDLHTSPLKTSSMPAAKVDAFEERLKNIKIANLLTDLDFSSDSEGLPSDVDELLNFSDGDIDESERATHGGKWKPSGHLVSSHSRGKWRPGGKIIDVGKHGKKSPASGKWKPDSVQESSGAKWKPGQRVVHGIGKHGKLRAAYKAYRGLTESEDEEELSTEKPKKTVQVPESSADRRAPVWCDVCEKSFKSPHYLDKHKTTAYHKKHMKKSKSSTKKSPSFKCDVCDKVFNSKYNFVRHLATENHTGDDIGCDPPHQSMSLDSNLQELLLRQKPFQCRLCLFYCDSEAEFGDHISSENHFNKTVGLLGPLHCVRCKFSTKENVELVKHVKCEEHRENIQKSDRPCVVKECRSNIACQQCDKTLTSWVKLWQHMKSAHSGTSSSSDKPLRQKGRVNRPRCPYCDTRWQCEAALQIHIRRRHSGEKPFICEVCKLNFSSKSDLSRHYSSGRHIEVAMQLGTTKTHPPTSTSFKPPETSQSVNKPNRTQQVRNATRMMKRCKYQNCEYKTTTAKSLRDHYKTTHENSRRYVCAPCGYGANHKSHWDKHCTSRKHLQLTQATAIVDKEEMSDKKAGFVCDVCQLAFNSELCLHKHKLVHAVTCENDLLKESHGDELMYLDSRFHMFVRSLPVDKDAQVQCRECGKDTVRKLIVEHLRSHTATAPFHCLYCEKSFQRGERLKAHLQLHFPRKWHICEHCPNRYRDVKSLKQHILSHHPQHVDFPVAFVCSTCGYKCMSRTLLRIHTMTHLTNNQKRFRCPWKGCLKRFQYKSMLNYHLRRHRKEKPYLCDQCGFAAVDRQHLNRHKRKHTGIRNYKCEYCTYSYFNSSGLRRHMRLHINAKPFSCPYPEECEFRSNCLEHIRKHVNNNSKHVSRREYLYPCKHCTAGFTLQADLRQHLTHVHNIEGTLCETSVCSLHPHILQKSLDVRAVPEGQKVNPVREQFVAKKWRQVSYSEGLKLMKGSQECQDFDSRLVVVTDIAS